MASNALACSNLPAGAAEAARGSGAGEVGREPFLAVSAGVRRAALEAALRELAAQALEIPPASLPTGRPLTTAGLDSLSAAELAQALEDRWGVALPLAVLLDGASVADIGSEILARLDAAPAATPDLACYPPWPREFPDGGETAAGVQPAAEHAGVRLSYGQRALWFLQRLLPQSSAYNLAIAGRIRGALDAGALRQAFQTLVDRHEILRTTFGDAGEEPLGRVHANVEVAFERHDASAWSPAALSRWLAEEGNRPFDLERGPLLRVALLTRSLAEPAEQVMLLTVHHLIADFVSLGVLTRELGALLEPASAAAVQPAGAAFGDFVERERRLVSGAAGDLASSFWRQALAGAADDIGLPSDRPRPPAATLQGARHRFEVPAGLGGRVTSLGRTQHATAFMVLLAAFQALLHRLTGKQDFVVASPVANRSRRELSGVVGYCVNPLPLRVAAADDPPFALLLDGVRRQILAAVEHQWFPFALLAERLHPERDASRSPVFQTMFNFLAAPPPAPSGLGAFALGEPGVRLDLGPVELECMPVAVRSSQLDLTLTMARRGSDLLASFEYSTDLFDATTVARWGAGLVRLLSAAVERPALRLSELSLLSAAERQQLLVEWNDTVLALPREAWLDELFAAQAARSPEATAVVAAGSHLSYGELGRRAGRVARELVRRGVRAEARVAVLMERTPELVAALLGVLQAGGAYVPLDPSYPAERLELVVADTGAAVLVSGRRLSARWPRVAAVVCVEELGAEEALGVEEEVGRRAAAEQLAYVIYTSGSTGRPKGVGITHRGAVDLVCWARQVFAAEELAGVLASTSICFDLSIFELFVPLSAGGTVVLMADALALASAEEAPRVTLINTVPSAMAELVRMGGIPGSVRTVNLAGEALRGELVERVLREGGCGGGVKRVLNLYGPSEDTTYSTWADAGAAGWLGASPPIGRPVANTEVYVLAGGERPVPLGALGELCLGGENLARGYLGRPELTAASFVPSPFGGKPGARLYRTGDLARHRADGQLAFLGRRDQQVKVRGFRIELGEIEACLGQQAGVEEAVVAAREAAGETSLAAYVVGAAAGALDVAELRRRLRQRLPEHMVPAHIVILPALPRTATGKVDRRRLPAPQPGGAGSAAPRGATEELLAAIWADVLAVDTVGRDDDFFALGGHSLKAVRLAASAGEAWDLDLPVRWLFEAPTLAELAVRIDGATAAKQGRRLPPIRPLPRLGPPPLSFNQQRLWFLDQLAPGNSFYSIHSLLRLRGPLPARALEQAFQEITRRHEVLRTSFPILGDEPCQVVLPASVRVLVVDLAGVDGAARWEVARRLAAADARRPFELAVGPPIRIALARLAGEDTALVVNVHHIAADGWSMGVLHRELGVLWQCFRDGRPSPLSELPVQYADYAVWQRQGLQGGLLAEQLDYWRRHLAGAPPLLALPTDRPRPAVESFSGSELAVSVAAPLTRGLRALGRRLGATPFMVLLAGWKALLARHSRMSDVVVGTAIANRTRKEIEGLIGFFTNTLVLRTRLSGDPSFRDVVARVREVALGAYAHQDIPFEKLVDDLQVERSLDRNPLCQVLLVLQNFPFQLAAGAAPELAIADLGTSGGDTRTSKFDLTLLLWDGPEGTLAGSVQFNSDLFDAATIQRLIGHYETLLHAVLEQPEAAVSGIGLLTAGESHQILQEWNPPAMAPDPEPAASLHGRFSRVAAARGEAAAVLFEDRVLSYAELEAKGNQLAHRLRRLGVGQETLVGVAMERSLEMLVALLGILKAGACYLPLDPAYPGERLAFLQEDSAYPVLLTQSRLRETVGAACPAGVEVLCLDDDWRLLAGESRRAPAAPVLPGNTAYVIYTSGSTGRPKGVPISHANVLRLFAAAEAGFRFGSGDVWTLFHSYAFDFSVWEIWGALLYGGRLVVVPHWVSRSPDKFLELLARRRVTVLNQTPSAFRQLVEAERHVPVELALRAIIFGGEALEFESLRPWLAAHGDEQPRLINMYGITETTVHVTLRAVRRRDLDPEPGGASQDGGRAGGGSRIGVPLADLRIRLVGPGLVPAPIGVAGEILVGGPGLSRGYLNRPALTAERFIPDPFSERPGERLYRSGDLARYLPDGDLVHLGRIDQQVKVRGFRVELGEIEAVLDQAPGVAASAVQLRQSGPGDPRLTAYVVPHQEEAAVACRMLRRQEMDGQRLWELPNGMVVCHLNRSETEFVYAEIFAQGEYLRHGITLAPDSCVFDVGANIGLFSLYVAGLCPRVRIYAFEPIPETFEVLRENVLLYALDAVLFDCGLAGEEKLAEFTHYPHVSVMSGHMADPDEERSVVRAFLARDWAGDGFSRQQIDELLDERLATRRYLRPLRRLSAVIRERDVQRIDLLKVDVEKSELEVLAGIDEGDWPKIQQVVVEVHDVGGRLAVVRSLLGRHGFTVTVVQEASLERTCLYNLYARRISSLAAAAPLSGGEPPAFVVPAAWRSPARLIADLREAARRRLPEYMVPAGWFLLDELPLTGNGKLDRWALAAAERRGPEKERNALSPRTPVEEALAAMWSEVLCVERLGVRDNFFDLGGHSLLATQLLARVRARFGIKLPLRALFGAPTVEGMAAALEQAAPAVSPPRLAAAPAPAPP
ncbi:MAG TPA: amino acid adenylation domain-containing protein, partial [Thermoanaerobaculia bacterium]|nr:amino acid adenylation domain-containing protein [Thermoanaerobaculia bacterium]